MEETFVLQQSVYSDYVDRAGSFRGLMVTTLANGRFVAAFENFGVRFQQYDYIALRIGDAEGTLGPRLEGPTSSLSSDADIVATADGGFLLSYTGQIYNTVAPTTPGDVFVSRYDASGTKLFTMMVNAVGDDPFAPGTPSAAQGMSSVVSLANGDFVVAFTDKSLDAGDVRFQLFTTGGAKQGVEVFAHVASAGIQRNVTATALADGGFLLVWETNANADGANGFDLVGRRFDANGLSVGNEVLLTYSTAGAQTEASVATLADGTLVMAFLSDGKVLFQRFDAGLTKIGFETVVDGTPATDVLVRAYPDGGFVIGWGNSVQLFNADGSAAGPVTAGPGGSFDVAADGSLRGMHVEAPFSATVFVDRYVMKPSAGVDLVGADASGAFSLIDERLYGTEFADRITGRGGNDDLNGYGGDDLLIGGAGTNRYFGGAGSDTASYEGATSGVVAALSNAANYPSIKDSFDSIENLTGSAFDDLLVGADGVNRLDGGAGDDRLQGNLGGDVLIGGDGSDTVLYGDAIGTVFVNLTLGRGYNNAAQDDTYEGIENAVGSNFADYLIGDAQVNRLDGSIGDDVLIGARGADVLIGGEGVDIAAYDDSNGTVFINMTLGRGYNNSAEGDTYDGIENIRGSNSDDYIIGDNSRNALDGAGGNDTLIGSLGADELIGGTGSDTVSYADNQGAVFINLLSGRGAANAAQGDVYTGIENAIGGLFDDYVIGDAGINRLDGAAGNDILIGGLGADVLVGGDGTDAVSYEDNWGAVFVNLTTARGNGNAAEGDSYSGIENVLGSAYYDTLIGDEGANRLSGARGNDTLVGNGGTDMFVFDTVLDPVINVDTITDFAPGTDKIVLDRDIFLTLSIGGLGPNNFINGTVATGGQNRIVYDQATGNLWFDDDGNGTDPAILFAVIENKPALTGADFLVIA